VEDFLEYVDNGDTTEQLVEYILLYLNQSDGQFEWLFHNKASLIVTYFTHNWDLNGKNGVPCDTTARPCYPLWALLVTLGSVSLCFVLTAALIMYVRKRRRQKNVYERIKETDL